MCVVIHNDPRACTGFRSLGKKARKYPSLKLVKFVFLISVIFAFLCLLCFLVGISLVASPLGISYVWIYWFLTILSLPIPRPFSLFNVNIVYSSTPVLTPLSTPPTIPCLLLAMKILTIMCIVETYSLINGDLIIVYIYSSERTLSGAWMWRGLADIVLNDKWVLLFFFKDARNAWKETMIII